MAARSVDSPFALMVRDASETVARIRKDAHHLRELGERAQIAARMAHAQFRKKLDGALEKVADGVLEMEAAVARAKGRTK